MRRRPFLALVGVTVGSGCVGSPEGAVRTESAHGTGKTGTRSPGASEFVVEMSGSTQSNYGGNYWFDPVGLAVPPGTTVTWRSGMGAPHTTTAYPDRIPAEAEPFASPHLPEGLTFEYAFDVPGVYDYYCVPHRTAGMVGRVVCGDPEGEPEAPPDGAVPSVDRIAADGRVPAAEL